MRFSHTIAVPALAALLLGCTFTGVENTGRVTDKEVQRVIAEIEARQPASALVPWHDSLPAWQPAKRFFVTDDQVRLLLDDGHDGYLDTTALAGSVITFQGLSQSPALQGTAVDILLEHQHHKLIYHTGKSLDAIPASFSIPLLVDLDMVSHVSRQLARRTAYVKTPVWYSLADSQMVQGRQFVGVTINWVEPGNKVLPLRVVFTAGDQGDSAFVWMSQPGAPMTGRDFDSMFSLANPRGAFPDIDDAHWTLIQHCQVETEMTKQECRLALGAPKRTSYVPDQRGMREYWYYDGGAYLFFVDGVLKEFRK